ncbi:MAG: trehalose-phosphatase, partial [Hydrogenophaga sp.]|nr:trehalose-phosphatase [Hydrogenophaga sp.]
MSTLPSLLAGPCALFLDFDGTLAELAPRPDEVVVPRELVALLERLHAQLDGALALVTGRA